MNCSKCGQAVAPDSQFCPHCGAATGVAPAKAPPVPAKLAKAADRFVGRVWALEKVDGWLQDGDERLFLLMGEPGAGKSQLAAWLCGAGSPPDNESAAAALARVRAAWSAACFCMSRGQGGSVDAGWFIRALVEQLANRHEGYAGAVLKAIDGLVDSVTVNVGENRGTVIGVKADSLKIGVLPDAVNRYTTTVVEPLRIFATANPSERIVILVDGVDEAIGQDPAIATLVALAANLPDNVRFLVTTRVTDRIVHPLRDAFDGSVAALDISSDAVKPCYDADILAYVNRRASESPAAPAMKPELAASLAEQAAGNFLFIDFLMDDLAAGLGNVDTLPSTPVKLYELYRSFLDRVVPGAAGAGVNEEWLSRYLPLLGTISVAVPSAPQAPLWQWLGWNESQLVPVIEPVQQLTEWTQDDGGGWRLYHRSMGEFLASPRYDDGLSPTPRPNSYYVSPPLQHNRIVDHYLKVLHDRWGGTWAACEDTYCLRNLVRHMSSGLDALPTAAARAERIDQIFALLGDPSFRARQTELLGGLDATVDDFRTALRLATGTESARGAQVVEILAASPEADLRGLAVEWLVGLFRREPPASIDVMRKLLASPASNAWRVAMNAAYQVS